MGEMANKIVAAILTVAWSVKQNGYVSEREIIEKYRKFYEAVK